MQSDQMTAGLSTSPTQPPLPDGAAGIAEYLELLAVIGQDFASSLDVTRTIEKALQRIADHLDAEASSVFLLDEGERTLVCRACTGPVDITGLRIGSARGIVGRAVQENHCQMVRDVRLDPDFARSVDMGTGFATRSVLCAPLSVKHRRVGAIELINKQGGDGLFSDQDRNALQALAASAALAIINTRLTAQLIEQERMRRELELAAEIQRNLLPVRGDPAFPVHGVNVAARGVSGDFYDCYALPDGRICFSVGDVSGKGINAALLMAKTVSLFHCLGKTISDPGKLLGMINLELCETGTRGMFVTMVAGLYEPASGILRFANAGHEPPLRRAAAAVYEGFPAAAPPLGIAPDLVPDGIYPVIEIALDADTFYVFTDGVTEGRTERDGMLGVEGLRGLLDQFQGLPTVARLSAVAEYLDRPDRELHDDLTILAVEGGGDAGRR